MGVAFTTMATLLLELSMTRIFSVVFYYHFAFLAISIALFGLGAGGVFSYVIAAQRGPLFRKLGRLSLVNAVLPVISVIFLLTRGKELTNLTLAAVYFFSALPFFVAGAIVSLAISETMERIDRVYFFDLLGAAGGCLLLIPLLNNFGGPNTVIAAAVLFAVGSAIWYNLDGHQPLRAASVAVALLLTVLVVFNTKNHWIDVHFAKGQTLDNEIFVRWNTFSRIAVAKEKSSGQTQIVIDADASTGIMDYNVDGLTPDQYRDLTQQGPAFPYLMRPGAKTLIIGPGGGWDVARAIAAGSKDITGVEINPIIANTIMKGEFAWISRNLYRRPGIRIHVEDGRAFVRRSAEKYSVLQATLVDTWASTAAGAFALSENNLYTTDAFEDYLNHLNDDGVLAITRWGFEPPRESVRLLILAREALAKLGETNPQRHVMVIREGTQKDLEGWGARDTVLISRKPFTDADVARAERLITTARFQRIYLPGDGAQSPFGQALLAQNLGTWLEQYPFDVTAVSDNRPFFFYTVQPRDLWNFLTAMNKDSADYKINRAVPMLFSLVGVSVLATLIILALPPLVLGTRLPREKGVLRFLMYFLCIGVGYILIQVALIQKFVLFLGNPTYALTVIIFSMLVSSGLGSYLSGRYVGSDDGKLMRVLALVTVLVSILAFSAAPITSALVGLPIAVKMLLTVVLIAPAGFCMGMPFPQGLARLEEAHKPSVRWAWSLNAASSVLGSAGAIFFAIYLGLRETLLLGGVLYLGALYVIKSTSTHRSQHVS
jgi:hypothetical protein